MPNLRLRWTQAPVGLHWHASRTVQAGEQSFVISVVIPIVDGRADLRNSGYQLYCNRQEVGGRRRTLEAAQGAAERYPRRAVCPSVLPSVAPVLEVV